MTTLYIVRHGKTNWNNQGLIQGMTDIELNQEGIKAAEELAKIINLDEIDICMSSPLKRAKKTAEIIVQNKKEIIYDDLLLERKFGDYEGTQITEELAKKQWDYKNIDTTKNLESIKDMLTRCEKFLNKIKTEYKDKRILIVSHGCLIKGLHFSITGYDENTYFLSFYAENTTIYKYEIK